MGIFFILFSMFACNVCSKSFANKGGLTQHCKGKKHLENISAPEKRKEIDALESAALAQRQKQSSESNAVARSEADASAIEATRVARVAQDAYEAAAHEQRKKIDALESAALAQRQKLAPEPALAIEAARVAQQASEAAAHDRRQNEASEAKRKKIDALESAALALLYDASASNQAARAASLAKYHGSVLETRASSLSTPVRGGFADEVKSPLF